MKTGFHRADDYGAKSAKWQSKLRTPKSVFLGVF
jgi:hypothetical protein